MTATLAPSYKSEQHAERQRATSLKRMRDKRSTPRPNGTQLTLIELQRLLQRIDIPAKGSLDACWLWTGRLTDSGYPLLDLRGYPSRAHRIMFEFITGQVLGDLELDHHRHCNRACVNPLHVTPRTSSEHAHLSEAHRRWAFRENTDLRDRLFAAAQSSEAIIRESA